MFSFNTLFSKDHQQPERAEECRALVKLRHHGRDLQKCLQQKRSSPGRTSWNVNFVSLFPESCSPVCEKLISIIPFILEHQQRPQIQTSEKASEYFDYNYLQNHSENLNYDVYLLCNKEIYLLHPKLKFSFSWEPKAKDRCCKYRVSYLSEVYLNLLEPHIYVGCCGEQRKIFQNI